MPNNKHKCEDMVKTQFLSTHKECHKSRSGSKKTGAFLNSFISGSNPFEARKKYHVCYNLEKRLKPINQVPKTPKIFEPVQKMSREERFEKRSRLFDELHVTLPPPSPSARFSTIEVSETEPKAKSSSADPNPIKETRFIDRISYFASRFHKPFKNLKCRKRVERLDELASMVIATCFDKKLAVTQGQD